MVFHKAIVIVNKPSIDVKRMYCVNARIGREDNNLRKNPHKRC